MTLDGFRAAAALVAARLRGDEKGERVLTGDCGCECRGLLEGLVMIGEIAVTTMASHDNVTPADATESVASWLRKLPDGSVGG